MQKKKYYVIHYVFFLSDEIIKLFNWFPEIIEGWFTSAPEMAVNGAGDISDLQWINKVNLRHV